MLAALSPSADKNTSARTDSQFERFAHWKMSERAELLERTWFIETTTMSQRVRNELRQLLFRVCWLPTHYLVCGADQFNTHTLARPQAANIHTRFNRRKIIIIFALAKELQCVSWRKKCASEKVWIYFFFLRVWCTAPTFVHGRVTLFCSLMRPNAQSRTLNRNLSTLLAKFVVSKLLKSIVALKKRVH